MLIFPEGTRTRDGQIAPFRPGFTALAVRRARPSCRWPIEARFRPGRAGGTGPAWAGSASASASPSRRPKSPAATNANCWPKSNAACASATPKSVEGGTSGPADCEAEKPAAGSPFTPAHRSERGCTGRAVLRGRLGFALPARRRGGRFPPWPQPGKRARTRSRPPRP